MFRYVIKKWGGLISKCEVRINNWSHMCLSNGWKLFPVKIVLEAILVFWMHFWIPAGVIEKNRR